MGVRADRGDLPAVWRWVFDAAVAGAAACFAVILTNEMVVEAEAAQRLWALLLAFLHGTVLIARRRAPAAVVSVVIATGLAYVALGLPVFFLGPASLIAVYTLATLRDRRTSVLGLAAAEVALAVGALTGGVQWDSWLLFTAVLAGSWLLGAALRRWQQVAREQAERADQLARARDDQARLAVTQERLRIARELHDVVAHSMSMIAVQAATGRLVIDRDPPRAGEALAAIEVTTRSALDEMRQLLAVLREDGRPGGSLDPTPGLTDVHDLVARMAQAGLTVEVSLTGDGSLVPVGVGVACYRIIQEGLTNVLKHAGQTHVAVMVACDDDAVTVDVRDRGEVRDGDHGSGQGTIGMRERAALYGGTFSAGPHPDGGWSVRVRLPYQSRPPAVTG
jgi:signal transduction histidine kinase